MIIKSLTGSFGKLRGETLELHPGLNVIEAPNESGKSTWCAFIQGAVRPLVRRAHGGAHGH